MAAADFERFIRSLADSGVQVNKSRLVTQIKILQEAGIFEEFGLEDKVIKEIIEDIEKGYKQVSEIIERTFSEKITSENCGYFINILNTHKFPSNQHHNIPRIIRTRKNIYEIRSIENGRSMDIALIASFNESLEEALTNYEQGNYITAIYHYNLAIEYCQERILLPGLYNKRGVAYLENCNYEMAIEDFSMSIQLGYDSFDVYYNRGAAYGLRASEKFDLAVAEERQSYYWHTEEQNDGMSFVTEEMTDFGPDCRSAIADLTVSIQKNPMFALSYACRGYLLGRMLFQGQEGMLDFDNALAIDSEDAFIYYLRGCLNVNINQISDLERAISLDSQLVDAYFKLGQLYLDKHKPNLAVKYFRQGVELHELSLKQYFRFAVFLVKYAHDQEDKKFAISCFTKCIEGGINADECHFYRADLYLDIDEKDKAMSDFHHLADNRMHAEASARLGRIYRREGNNELAEKYFKQAKALDDKYAWEYDRFLENNTLSGWSQHNVYREFSNSAATQHDQDETAEQQYDGNSYTAQSNT